MANQFTERNDNYSRVLENIERTCDSIYLRGTTVEEIEKLIRLFNSNKAPGFNGISNYIIKCTVRIVSLILVKLFNSCMELGIFPDKFKIACIIPLFKGGEKDEPTNYRPISLLPIFSKLFEKVIETRFVKFLNKKKLICPHQFGFRKHHSTELAVVEIQNMLLKNMDEKKLTRTIFLDLAKAFDTIDHSILLKKTGKVWYKRPGVISNEIISERSTTYG